METDPGIEDKRLLAIEGELARALAACDRYGNTLSAVIRHAWDGLKLSTLTKNQSATATGAHISIIGHITRSELLTTLSQTQQLNGFANRFLWICARRSKLLPWGGDFDGVARTDIVSNLQRAIVHAQTERHVLPTSTARDIWEAVYPELSEGRAGLLGSVTSRAEAQVMRLAMVYALMDCSAEIDAEHLQAALELWEYSASSARYIFGASTGDSVADRILATLIEEPFGLSKTDLRDLFGRHKSKTEVDRALATLSELGLIRCKRALTGGRPLERWFAVQHCDKSDESEISQ